MKHHPEEGEWAAFLYQEIPATRRRELEEHLRQCPSCRQRVEEWQTSRRALDQWTVTVPSPARPQEPRGSAWFFPALVRWAAAALVLVCAGYLLGRHLPGQAPLSDDVMAQVSSEVRTAVLADLKHSLATNAASRADLESVVAALQSLLDGQASMAHSLAEAEQQQQSATRKVWETLLRLESDRQLDYANLRRELETVALHSEGHWRQARDGLVALASHGGNETLETDSSGQP